MATEMGSGLFYAPYIPQYVVYMNKYGHDYSYDRDPYGYGICRCGALENSDESIRHCPVIGERHKEGKNYDGKNYEVGT